MYGLQQNGFDFLVPFGENTRYDLVIDHDGTFSRVQCKTGRFRDGAIEFNTVSCYGHHPNPRVTRRSYVGDVDYFGVFCHETGGLYLVPIDDVPSRSTARLRLNPPRNQQRKRIRFAADYEIANVSRIRLIRLEPGARAGGSGSSA